LPSSTSASHSTLHASTQIAGEKFGNPDTVLEESASPLFSTLVERKRFQWDARLRVDDTGATQIEVR
jgi:hypothetical protein